MLSKEDMRDCLEYIRKALQPLFERIATLEGKVEILTATNKPSDEICPLFQYEQTCAFHPTVVDCGQKACTNQRGKLSHVG